MAYVGIQGGVLAQSDASSRLVQGDLPRILDRILGLTTHTNEMADKLRDHANRVHGARPEACSTEQACAPVRSGLVGEIEDALDRLWDAHVSAAEQASRNCTLA